MKFLKLILLFIFLPSLTYASHIVGGEIYYECLGNFEYKITIKIYRDCRSSTALDGDPNDPSGNSGSMKVGVFKADGSSMPMAFPIPVVTPVIPNISKECMVSPPAVCLEQGYYTFNVTLPPSPGGYDIVYIRCCRNASINNLVNPGAQGASYWEHIPDPGNGCNNGPYFKNFPPVIICANENLKFDHSAIDPDGDSLSYEFCETYQGGSQTNPYPGPTPPPYIPVVWGPGFNASAPIISNPPIKIDPVTGLITGRPTQIGQFVVGVCVKEYKNGVLIATHRRDFQFNITECIRTIDALIDLDPADSAIVNCDNFTVSFKNLSKGATNYFWDFGVTTTNSDTSILKDPTFIFPDTGFYKVMLVAEPGVPCSDTDYVHVYIYPIHKSDFAYDKGCPYDTINFRDSTFATYGQVNSWEWFFGNGTKSQNKDPGVLYDTGTSYIVTLVTTTSKGCRDAISKKINLYPVPDVGFSYDSTCYNRPVYFINSTSLASGGIAQYQWHVNNDPISKDTDFTYTFTDTGFFNIKLTALSDNGCSDTIDQIVRIDLPTAAGISADTGICINDKAFLTASGGMFYQWTPPVNIENDTSAATFVAPPTTTTYTVVVSDKCYWDTATVTVKVNQLPDINVRSDTSIFRRDSVLLFGSGSGHLYKWAPPNFVTDINADATFASPLVTTTYTLSTTDSNRCTSSKSVIIYVREVCNSFYIPNAFSPNGDGINDIFYLKDYGDSKLVLFQVYNRWGELVFQTNSLENGWDGLHNGDQPETGVYSYNIVMDCGERIVQYGGNITLLK